MPTLAEFLDDNGGPKAGDMDFVPPPVQTLENTEPNPLFTFNSTVLPQGDGDMPAPKPKPAGSKVAVRTVDIPDAKADFLKSQAGPLPLPSPAVDHDEIAKATAAPDQPDELKKLQDDARSGQRQANTGALLADAGNIIRGGASQFNDISKRTADQAQQSVKDLTARRDAARQALQDKQAASLDDENSDSSQLATKLAQSRGLIAPGQKITARQWGTVKDAGSMDEAKARLAAEDTRQKAEIASREKEGAAGRSNALTLERERMANERAMHLEDINAKNGKNSQVMPLPEQEASKIVTMGQALPAIDQLEEQFKKGGALSPNENAKYEFMKNALAPIIAAGAAPAARENAQLMEEFKKGMPGVSSVPGMSVKDDNGKVFFENLRKAVKNNQDAQISALGASGKYDQKQVENLRRGAEAGGQGATKVPIATKVVNGKTYEKHPDGWYEVSS